MVLHRGNLEFQPGAAGQFHFGAEPQQVIGLERLDAPEVHHVSDAEIDRIAPAATQPHSSDCEVEQPAEPPEPIPTVPARPAADALDRSKGGVSLGLQPSPSASPRSAIQTARLPIVVSARLKTRHRTSGFPRKSRSSFDRARANRLAQSPRANRENLRS